MIPLLNLPQQSSSFDIFPSEASDIAIINSVAAVSLTSVSAANTAEKFVIPSRRLDEIGGRGALLDLILTYRNNEGTARAITLTVSVGGVSAISGTGSTIGSAAINRSCLLRVGVRRTGAITGLITSEWTIGGSTSFASGITARAHASATLPAVGSPVTVAVTASLAVASTELTLSVDRRRAYVF